MSYEFNLGNFSENILYGIVLVVALCGCFYYGYGECVQIIVAGLIGAYTGNKISASSGELLGS